jgi:phosphoadenosine phosphosulfate reductase
MIIYFSGGKDSLAVLHMFKDDPDLECVYFGDTGDIYPHMMKFVIDTCKKFNVPLEIIKAKMSQEKYHAEFGYPSDMVPVVRSPDAKSTMKNNGAQRLQSFMQCCANMCWLPMQERSLGKVVYRGIKKCDEHGTDVENGYTNPVSGIQYINPIYNWTDDMVFEYLKKNNVELARHYKQINVSMDCVHCTAFTHSPTTVDRLRWTKENYPSYWPEIQNRFKKVKEAIDAEAKIIDEPFDFVLNNRG